MQRQLHSLHLLPHEEMAWRECTKMGCKHVNGIAFAQDRVRWWAGCEGKYSDTYTGQIIFFTLILQYGLKSVYIIVSM
jgi:hypothetical protein